MYSLSLLTFYFLKMKLILFSCFLGLAHGSVLVFGGYGGSTGEILTSTEQILDDGRTCLTNLPALPGGYYGQVASIINSQVLLCGGWNDFGVTNECFLLDLTVPNPDWHVAPPLNEKRVYATSIVHDNTVMVLGGYSDAVGQNLDSVEVWDPIDKSWKYDRRMRLPIKLSRHCLVEHENVLIIIGGEGSDKVFGYINQAWQEFTPFPSGPIDSHACLSSPNGIILTGGKTLEQNELKETWIFQDDTWTELGPLWNPRKSHGMAMLDGLPTVFGGYDFIPYSKKETGMIEQLYSGAWEDTNYDLTIPRLMFSYVTQSVALSCPIE